MNTGALWTQQLPLSPHQNSQSYYVHFGAWQAVKKSNRRTWWIFLWFLNSRWRRNPVPSWLSGMTTAQILSPSHWVSYDCLKQEDHAWHAATFMHEDAPVNGGEYTGKKSHRWRMQDSGMCCDGGKAREYLNVNLRRWISQWGQRAPCLCPLGPSSLPLSDQLPLNNAPPPVLFFSPGTGICGASPQKQD